MKIKQNSHGALSRLCCRVALWGVVFSIASAAFAAPPTPAKVGQTIAVTLDAKSSRDYAVSLGKGDYRIIWDAQRVDGRNSNIMPQLQMLKPNGSIIDSNLISFNELGVVSRVGKTYHVIKPFVARLRLKTDDAPLKMWLTLVPVAQKNRVPFGWGAKVTPARISSDNGVGGELEPYASVFHSITLPAGKWSISLGLKLPDGENSNLMGSIDRLDAQGLMVTPHMVNMNEIDNQARQEAIVTLLKPTYLLLRVNNNDNKTYAYDVTIEKAS